MRESSNRWRSSVRTACSRTAAAGRASVPGRSTVGVLRSVRRSRSPVRGETVSVESGVRVRSPDGATLCTPVPTVPVGGREEDSPGRVDPASRPDRSDGRRSPDRRIEVRSLEEPEDGLSGRTELDTSGVEVDPLGGSVATRSGLDSVLGAIRRTREFLTTRPGLGRPEARGRAGTHGIRRSGRCGTDLAADAARGIRTDVAAARGGLGSLKDRPAAFRTACDIRRAFSRRRHRVRWPRRTASERSFPTRRRA